MIASVAVASETLRSSTGLAAPASDHRRDGTRRRDYLPREVFFGRFGFAGVCFSVWGSDFSRFFPATSASFGCSCSQVTR